MMAVLLSGVLLAVLNQTLLSPAFPSIMAEYGIDATTVQWLTSGYSLVEALVIPLSAYLIGRFSTRRLFIAGLVSFVAGSLLAAWAPNFSVLLLGRVLQAVCTGIVMPMSMTIILLVFPREKRGAAMGVIGLIIGFAPAVGPSLSGLLIDSVGWHMLFLLVAGVALIVLACAAVFLKAYGSFERVPLDWVSVVLSSVGLVCLLYGLSTFASSSNYIATIAFIVAGAFSLALFVKRQLALEVPMLRVDILKSHRYAVAVSAIGLMQAALIGLSVVLPLYVQMVLGQSATASGLATLPGALLGAVTSLIAGRLFDRQGARRVSLAGALLAVVGGAMLCSLGMDASILYVTVSYAAVSIAMQCIMTPLNTWGINSLDNSVVQHANSLSNTVNQVAGSFGSALIVSFSALSTFFIPQGSALEQAYLGDHIAFIGVTALFLAVLAIVLFLVRDQKAGGSSLGSSEVDAGGSSEYGVFSVASAMNPLAPSLSDKATVADALDIFGETETSGIPITNAQREVVGFVSDGDVMKYLGKSEAVFTDPFFNLYRVFDDEDLLLRIQTLLQLDVMRIATRQVIGIDGTMPFDEACRILAEKRIKKVPVVREGKLVGTLSRRNIIRILADEARVEKDALTQVQRRGGAQG